MSEFDIGKTAKLKRSLMIGLDQGDMVVIAESNNDSEKTYVHFGYHLNKSDLVLVDEFKPDYKTSNRKKLKDAVIKTGFSSKDLSIAMGFNDNYLSGYISKSRMSERGDISEEQLNSLKVSILFSERTLNGTGAETVDELKFGGDVGVNDIIDDFIKNNPSSSFSYEKVDGDKKVIVSYEEKKSNFIKLQKLAFAMCFIMAILLISILYFVVSG